MSLNNLNGYLRNTFLPLINSFNQSDAERMLSWLWSAFQSSESMLSLCWTLSAKCCFFFTCYARIPGIVRLGY